MTTLITGATGFLGGVLAQQLVERGDRVRALVRASSDRSGLKGLGVEFAIGDVTDRESVMAAARGCERVYHVAALVKTWVRDRSLYERVNLDGARNVIEAATRAGAVRIVYTSTFLVLKPGERMSEDAPASEDEVWTEYARTKRLAEIEVRRLASEGAPVVTLYPGVIFGPGKLTAGNLIVDWIVRFCRGKFPGFLGKGARIWSFAYARDVAKGHLLADEKGEVGRGYCLGGENVSIREFMTTVAEMTGREPSKRCVPFGIAKFVGFLQECRAFITGREPELTRGIVDTFRNHWALDSSRAKEELGYEPTPMRQAIEETLAWLRKEKHIEG